MLPEMESAAAWTEATTLNFAHGQTCARHGDSISQR